MTELAVALSAVEPRVGAITKVDSPRQVDGHGDRTTKKPAAKTTSPKSVDAYLAAAPKDMRAALLKIRKTIRAAAPGAVEGIVYGIAGFKYNGKPLEYFGFAKAHLRPVWDRRRRVCLGAEGLRPQQGHDPVSRRQAPPGRLVTKIVKARVAEIEQAS